MKHAGSPWTWIAITALVLLAAAILLHGRTLHEGVSAPATAQASSADASQLRSKAVVANALNTARTTSVEVPRDWAREFAASTDYFAFVSGAAQKAFDGDSRAAFYIFRALYLCDSYWRMYRKEADPQAAFNADSAQFKADQWFIDKTRRDFQACSGFLKGDAFAALPHRQDGYFSIRYWKDRASEDPIGQVDQAASALYKLAAKRNGESKAPLLQEAQEAINKAVASQDPYALFRIGQILTDGLGSDDPIQGFALALAACDLGYDCSPRNADNLMIYGNCVETGLCPAGIQYADVVKQAVGESGYAAAYARALQIEDAIRRGDAGAINNAVVLHPILRLPRP